MLGLTGARVAVRLVSPVRDRDVILRHTVVASPYLCPEIRLRLITPACALWRATEEDAARIGLVEPYWAFPWAGGQALARFILDEPWLVRDKTVLDFGAGGAVEGIAAVMAGARVTVADIDPMAVSAAHLNAELNGVELASTTENLVGTIDPGWDVLLAGDVFYGDDLSKTVMAWLLSVAAAGVLVLVSDADRGFLEVSGLERRARFDAPADNDDGASFMQKATVYAVGGAPLR